MSYKAYCRACGAFQGIMTHRVSKVPWKNCHDCGKDFTPKALRFLYAPSIRPRRRHKFDHQGRPLREVGR